MEMDHRDSDPEGSIMVGRLSGSQADVQYTNSSPELQVPFPSESAPFFDKSGAEVSETEEEGANLRPAEPQAPTLLPNIKQEREELKVGLVGWGGGVYLPPPAAVPPLSATPQQPPPGAGAGSSASSHSSESSTSSHHAWSFEEQFKQVTKTTTPLNGNDLALFSHLYELSEDPKRKEFLDDLFSFMQRRGTPINRLPIMAKSVLDLYELYNLVIQRGGLVDVINKKLWQEIIKGLHLPSSITSAAFTLRTQYMKYLYPYECEKRRLSTPGELQAAIDGNRREGRRGSYGTYAEMMQRSPGQQVGMSPLSLVHRPGPVTQAVNGNHHHNINNNHLTPGGQTPTSQPLLPPPVSGPTNLAPIEFEARMLDYVKLLNKEFSTPISHRQNSPPVSPPDSGALNPLEMSRFSLWNLYHGSVNVPSPEPQKEALNLEKRSELAQPPNNKRHHPDNDDIPATGTHIKISSRGDGRGGSDNSLVVSMDINGTIYQGVLFAQTARSNRLQS